MNKIMKGDTQDEYEKAVNKAIDYINNHLFINCKYIKISFSPYI